MPDEPDPPRKFYEFKPREFEVVNPRTGAPQPTAPITVQELLRQAGSSPSGGVAPAKPSPRENDVHAILRENLARANSTGLNALAPKPKRPSRRKRDFWFLLISGNTFILLVMLTLGGIGNPMAFVSAIGGVGLFTAALIWVMWFVMDDY